MAFIINIVHNQKEFFLEWMKIAEKMAGVSRESIVVVDNYSEDGLREYLEMSDMNYIICDEYLENYSVIVNTVIKEYNLSGDIYVTSPSYLLMPDTLYLLGEALHSEDDVLAVSAVPLSGTYGAALDVAMKRSKQGTASLDTERTLAIDPFCMMVDSEVFWKMGGFDEKIQLPESAVKDFSLKGIMSDMHNLRCKDALVFRMKDDAEMYRLIMGPECDRPVMKEKWGMNYFNTQANYFLISLIKQNHTDAFNILEIGCDCGANLIEVRNRYPSANLYGVEINEHSAGIAAHLFPTQIGNIEEKNLQYGDIKFDYIMFGDVLEHLRDPAGAIGYCRKLLNKGGRIITSIPNLMHYTVMRSLLNGDFTYTDTGLLDRTHIHFFTLNEIVKMFTQEGYTIEDAVFTSDLSTNLQENQEFIDKLMSITERAERYMFTTFQYMIKARAEEKQTEECSYE